MNVSIENAMLQEQKKARKSSLAPGESRSAFPLHLETLRRYAGFYMVCHKCPSGFLIPLSGKSCYDNPYAAVNDWVEAVKLQREVEYERTTRTGNPGTALTLVVGLCSRSRKGWFEPKFLPTVDCAKQKTHSNGTAR